MERKISHDINELQHIIAEKIKDYLAEKGLNLTSFAKNCGVPRSTLSNWLLCTRTIQIDSLCKIADYMGVSTDYLLGRED